MPLIKDDRSVAHCGFRSLCIHGARPPKTTLDNDKFNQVSQRCVDDKCSDLKWTVVFKGKPRIVASCLKNMDGGKGMLKKSVIKSASCGNLNLCDCGSPTDKPLEEDQYNETHTECQFCRHVKWDDGEDVDSFVSS